VLALDPQIAEQGLAVVVISHHLPMSLRWWTVWL